MHKGAEGRPRRPEGHCRGQGRGRRHRPRPILTSAGGRPWTIETFKQAWRYAFLQSKIVEDLHFHDIRGTAVTTLAEAVYSVAEIATITGHSQAYAQKILDRYLARTRALAESAIAKLDQHRRNKVLQTAEGATGLSRLSY